jgi:hypothetical protein
MRLSAARPPVASGGAISAREFRVKVPAGVTAALCCAAAIAAAGCREAGSAEVQPLPPLERPSPEARAGLPEMAGTWRFAGFEIPPADTAPVRMGVWRMTPPGEVRVETQRLDSVAGRYVREGGEFPVVGEVRRDSTFAVVALGGGDGSIVAGRFRRDTLWIELTTLSAAETWPRGTRAGLVRRPPGEPFLRLVGGAPIAVPADTAPPVDGVAPPAGVPPAEGPPPAAAPARPPAPAQPTPAQPTPAQPAPAEPAQPRPEPQRPVPPAREPERPAPQPQRPPPAEPEPARPEPPAPAPPVVAPPPPAPLPAPAGPRDTIRFEPPP